MSYCLNSNCYYTQNADNAKFCSRCGNKLLLLDRYRAIRLLGQGGFGKTFLAVDEAKPSKPRCAIKQFSPQGQGDLLKAAELFQQEAIRLEELGTHPQIPGLLGHCQQNNSQYIIQEFIDGQNLEEELNEQGVFTALKIQQLLESLLPVLDFIHQGKVIHRDIKPANIIRRRVDSQFCLVDFGASKYATGTALAKTGTAIGSAEYTPFEQLRGKAIFASDIYSLGVTCLYLLTHISPFDLMDGSNKWVWRDYLHGQTISDRLGSVLDKMVSQVPSQRYQSASEVMQDLAPKTAPQPPSQPQPLQPNSSRQQLKSAFGLDYSNLQEFLRTSNWQEADRETKRIMLVIANLACNGSLSGSNLQKFPCADLQILNQLWLDYGKEDLVTRIRGGFGRYGFGFVVFSDLEARMRACNISANALQTQSSSPLIIPAGYPKEFYQLEEFLSLCLWRQADEQTRALILKLARCESLGYLNSDSLHYLGCDQLQVIDRLWRYYSGDRFGLSIQKKVWDSKDMDAFYEQVGWCNAFKWIPYQELDFTLSAPPGHLPWWCGLFRRDGFGQGFIVANFWAGWHMDAVKAFVSKLETCDL